jgi:hypothetical protein
MPSLTGLTFANAAARAAAAGVHIASIEDINLPVPPAPTAPTPNAPLTPATPAPATAVPPGTVVDQSPPSGYRVVRGEAVHITLTH